MAIFGTAPLAGRPVRTGKRRPFSSLQANRSCSATCISRFVVVFFLAFLVSTWRPKIFHAIGGILAVRSLWPRFDWLEGSCPELQCAVVTCHEAGLEPFEPSALVKSSAVEIIVRFVRIAEALQLNLT